MPKFPIYATEGEIRVPGYMLTLVGLNDGDEVELTVEGHAPYTKAIIRPTVERARIGREES